MLALARKEADRFNHSFVGTEHLLLGLIRLGQGLASKILLRLGLDSKTVREEVEKAVRPAPEDARFAQIPYTPRVKKVLVLALKEAVALRHTYVGTEHLLLGLLSEGEGVAALVFRNHKLDIEQTRQEILKQMAPGISKPFSAETLRASHMKPGPPVEPVDIAKVTNFTSGARQLLVLAEESAIHFQHSFIGTEHLLLGLLALGEGLAVNVLQRLGLDFEAVRKQVEAQIGFGPDQKVFGRLPYTPRVKKIVALAAKEAISLEHPQIGPEHILLGLLREGQGVAAPVLVRNGMSLEKVRQEILRESAPGISNLLPEEITTDEDAELKSPVESTEVTFTAESMRMLLLARKEVDRLRHHFIGTEHLLLGLIGPHGGLALEVLLRLGLDLEAIRKEVESVLGSGPDDRSVVPVRYTPRVKKVLAFAAQEAVALNSRQVGPEHILLGLLREGDGVAGRVLLGLGMNIEKVRVEIRKGR